MTFEIFPDRYPKASITVSDWEWPDDSRHEPLLIVGGISVTSDDRLGRSFRESRLVSRFPDLYDEEHDRSHAFDLDIAQPNVTWITDTGIEIVGTVKRLATYLSDEELADAYTPRRGGDLDLCDQGQYCRNPNGAPHYIGGKYVPPTLTKHTGKPVIVRLEFIDPKEHS